MAIRACTVQFLHYIPLYRNTQHYATLNCSVKTCLRAGGTLNDMNIPLFGGKQPLNEYILKLTLIEL